MIPETAEQSPPRSSASGKPATDWIAEARSIALLILAVLGFHSLIAKPFYIPSESMLPGLLVGDGLVVTKYPYGWSWVSATFHLLPPMPGRIFAQLPERGDIVIVTPPGSNEDYIKRVIGLPGDRLEVRRGTIYLDGRPVRRGPVHNVDIRNYGGAALPSGETTCDPRQYPGAFETAPGGMPFCLLPIVRETLPNGRSYDTVDLGYDPMIDDYPAITIPPNHVFLMGDNRQRSADSRVAIANHGLGGPVPFENIGGRAEFVTFSFGGSARWWNPIGWLTSLRKERVGHSLHATREGS